MSVPLRSCRDLDAEAWVLTEKPGQRLLAEVTEVPAPRPADISRWRKLAPPHVVAAAVRLAACRAKAKAKFSRGDRMWLDPVGLEQATGEAVARHKAGRFACPLVVDLCAGIGGDSVALAQKAKVLAVDCDHGMCRRLAWNAAVYEVADRVRPCRSRAESFTIPPGAWIHLDPDRRASRQERARRLAGYTPGLESLRSFVRLAPGGAIKLSPSSDFAAHFSGPEFEVELISLKENARRPRSGSEQRPPAGAGRPGFPKASPGRTGMAVSRRLSGSLSFRSRPSSTIPTRPCSAPACSTPSPPSTV